MHEIEQNKEEKGSAEASAPKLCRMTRNEVYSCDLCTWTPVVTDFYLHQPSPEYTAAGRDRDSYLQSESVIIEYLAKGHTNVKIEHIAMSVSKICTRQCHTCPGYQRLRGARNIRGDHHKLKQMKKPSGNPWHASKCEKLLPAGSKKAQTTKHLFVQAKSTR